MRLFTANDLTNEKPESAEVTKLRDIACAVAALYSFDEAVFTLRAGIIKEREAIASGMSPEQAYWRQLQVDGSEKALPGAVAERDRRLSILRSLGGVDARKPLPWNPGDHGVVFTGWA